MTKTLQVSGYTRRAPIDKYAAVKAAKTEQLVMEVMEMELRRIVNEAFAVSSNGRTADFGSANTGSSPVTAAMELRQS